MHMNISIKPEIEINGVKYKETGFILLNLLITIISLTSKMLLLKIKLRPNSYVYSYIIAELFKSVWNCWLILLIITQNLFIIGTVLLSVTTAKLLTNLYDRKIKKNV